jgi:hypothetical protein
MNPVAFGLLVLAVLFDSTPLAIAGLAVALLSKT